MLASCIHICRGSAENLQSGIGFKNHSSLLLLSESLNVLCSTWFGVVALSVMGVNVVVVCVVCAIAYARASGIGWYWFFCGCAGCQCRRCLLWGRMRNRVCASVSCRNWMETVLRMRRGIAYARMHVRAHRSVSFKIHSLTAITNQIIQHLTSD